MSRTQKRVGTVDMKTFFYFAGGADGESLFAAWMSLFTAPPRSPYTPVNALTLSLPLLSLFSLSRFYA
jgi:hypothetical protein